jgi:hypothetical protein
MGFWGQRIVLGVSLFGAFALNAPSLRVGLFADDFAHRRFILDHLQGHPGAAAWWNMFDSRVPVGPLDPDPSTLFGRLPWWSLPEFSFALLRPLSAASHFLDYLLWPNTPWLMHAHNLAVELEVDGGYLSEPTTLFVRRKHDRFSVDQRFEVGELQIAVRAVSPDGRPSRVEARSRHLTDGSLYYVYWTRANDGAANLTAQVNEEHGVIHPPP